MGNEWEGENYCFSLWLCTIATYCLSIPPFSQTHKVLGESHPPSSLLRGSECASYTKSNPHGLSLDGSFVYVLPKVWHESCEGESPELTIAL